MPPIAHRPVHLQPQEKARRTSAQGRSAHHGAQRAHAPASGDTARTIGVLGGTLFDARTKALEKLRGAAARGCWTSSQTASMGGGMTARGGGRGETSHRGSGVIDSVISCARKFTVHISKHAYIITTTTRLPTNPPAVGVAHRPPHPRPDLPLQSISQMPSIMHQRIDVVPSRLPPPSPSATAGRSTAEPRPSPAPTDSVVSGHMHAVAVVG